MSYCQHLVSSRFHGFTCCFWDCETAPRFCACVFLNKTPLAASFGSLKSLHTLTAFIPLESAVMVACHGGSFCGQRCGPGKLWPRVLTEPVSQAGPFPSGTVDTQLAFINSHHIFLYILGTIIPFDFQRGRYTMVYHQPVHDKAWSICCLPLEPCHWSHAILAAKSWRLWIRFCLTHSQSLVLWSGIRWSVRFSVS